MSKLQLTEHRIEHHQHCRDTCSHPSERRQAADVHRVMVKKTGPVFAYDHSLSSATCSPPRSFYTQSSLPLTAAGELTQGHLLQPLHVNSFIHFKPAVRLYWCTESHQANWPLPPFLILFNLNWYLPGCPAKCVQFKDIILLFEIVGVCRMEKWRDTAGPAGPLAC